jgi:hypothetical protein
MTLYVFSSSVNAEDYIPKKAYLYSEMIDTSITNYFPELYKINLREYIPALIEHESCITLKDKKCWEPSSRLKTNREEGAGLGQLTRTYNEDGSLRFDSLKNMSKQYKKDLKELTWASVYTRPDLQIDAITLMSRDNYRQLNTINDEYQRLAMTDAAYNGGMRDLYKERRLCSLMENCDPNIWFGNVETACVKSKKAMYGFRSACDINRHHVRDVMKSNLPKYQEGMYFDYTITRPSQINP